MKKILLLVLVCALTGCAHHNVSSCGGEGQLDCYTAGRTGTGGEQYLDHDPVAIAKRRAAMAAYKASPEYANDEMIYQAQQQTDALRNIELQLMLRNF